MSFERPKPVKNEDARALTPQEIEATSQRIEMTDEDYQVLKGETEKIQKTIAEQEERERQEYARTIEPFELQFEEKLSNIVNNKDYYFREFPNSRSAINAADEMVKTRGLNRARREIIPELINSDRGRFEALRSLLGAKALDQYRTLSLENSFRNTENIPHELHAKLKENRARLKFEENRRAAGQQRIA